MADLAPTAADVRPGKTSEGARTRVVVAAEDIDAGEAFRLDSSDEAHMAAAAGTVEQAALEGIALSSASAGQPFEAHIKGPFNPGATLRVGETYYLSDTAGKLRPAADVGDGEYISIAGVALDAETLDFQPNVSGVKRAAVGP